MTKKLCMLHVCTSNVLACLQRALSFGLMLFFAVLVQGMARAENASPAVVRSCLAHGNYSDPGVPRVRTTDSASRFSPGFKEMRLL